MNTINSLPIIVVTRHPALVTLLRERGIITETTAVVSHVSDSESLRGHHVIGVLPMHLAVCAEAVSEVTLALTESDRGKELHIERLREIAGPMRTYRVRQASPEEVVFDHKFYSAAERDETIDKAIDEYIRSKHARFAGILE